MPFAVSSAAAASWLRPDTPRIRIAVTLPRRLVCATSDGDETLHAQCRALGFLRPLASLLQVEIVFFNRQILQKQSAHLTAGKCLEGIGGAIHDRLTR